MANQYCRTAFTLLKPQPNIDRAKLNTKLQQSWLMTKEKRNIHQQKSPVKSMGMLTSTSEVRPLSEIPGPKGVPVFGTLPFYWMSLGSYSLPNYLRTLQSMRKKYGDVVKEQRGGETIVHLFNENDIRAMYKKEGKYPAIAPVAQTTQAFRKGLNKPLGLGNQNGEEWLRIRRKIQFLMRPKKIEEFIGHTDDAANRFIAKLKQEAAKNNGHVTEFLEHAERWAVESNAQIFYDRVLGLIERSPASEPIQEFIDTFIYHLKLSTKVQFSSVTLHRYFNTPIWKEIVVLEDFKYQIVKEVLGEAIDNLTRLSENGELRDDQYMFLRRMLTSDTPEAIAELKDTKSENYRDILTLLLSIFGGDAAVGTAPLVSSTLYLFAKYPEKQEKCYKEVMENLGNASNLTMGMMDDMPYLKSSIKEARRLYPLCPEVSRMPAENVTVSGYEVPAGTMVHSNSYAVLRSPDYFRQPNEFLPERWMKGDMEENTDPYRHLPFSFGPRQCAGRRISEQDTNACVAKILQNFKVEWTGEGELGQIYQVLMAPDRPISFKLTPRK